MRRSLLIAALCIVAVAVIPSSAHQDLVTNIVVVLTEIGRTACDLSFRDRHPPRRRQHRPLALPVVADEAVQVAVPQQRIADDVQRGSAFGGRHTGRPELLRELGGIVVSGQIREVEVERVGMSESVRQRAESRVVGQRGRRRAT